MIAGNCNWGRLTNHLFHKGRETWFHPLMLPSYVAGGAFEVRLEMLDIKQNYKHKYKDTNFQRGVEVYRVEKSYA